MADRHSRRARVAVMLVGVYLGIAIVLTVVSGSVHDRFQTEPGLTRSFYDNPNFEGSPVRREVSRDISLAFLDEHQELPRRFFSVRWSGVWYLPAAQTVDLYVGGDDRVVVSIDGQPVLERSARTSFDTVSRSLTLTAGMHRLSINYRQRGGGYGLTVLAVPTGNAPRSIDPETLFPSPPSSRALVVNRRLALLGSLVTTVWLVPPALLLTFVGLPALVRIGARSATGRVWLGGAVLFTVAFGGYYLNTLRFETLIFDREQQNVIFSADTWTTVGSMSSLSFREHIRQHPLFSLVTSTVVQGLQAVSPLTVNRAILITLALIAGINCTLAYLILYRVTTSIPIAGWFAAVYGCLFANLALFSIPETYALSTTAVLVYLLAAAGARSPIGPRQLVTLTLLAGLAGLFNPPLLSLSLIHIIMLLRGRALGAALPAAAWSLAATLLLFVAVNAAIFGPEFYQNYIVDNERYGSFEHFREPSSIATVLCGLFLFGVIAPRDQLAHDYTVANMGGYVESVPAGLAILAYAVFILYAIRRLRPHADPFQLGVLLWLAAMTVFYVYFNPDGVMLYSVQTLFPPLLFSALAFAKLTLPSVQKYVALALFVGLVVLRNVPAIYAAVEILPRS